MQYILYNTIHWNRFQRAHLEVFQEFFSKNRPKSKIRTLLAICSSLHVHSVILYNNSFLLLVCIAHCTLYSVYNVQCIPTMYIVQRTLYIVYTYNTFGQFTRYNLAVHSTTRICHVNYYGILTICKTR